MSNIKKPTGLSITRTGRKFKASWKKRDSYSTMQCAWGYQTPNSIVEGKIVPVSHTHSVKTFNDTVTFVTFAVRGKKNGKWSDWAEKSVRIYVPKTPDVSAEFVQTAKTTFTWNPVKDNHERPIIEAIVQTILVKDCPDGRDAIASLPEWSDENNMTEYIQGESGSITPVDGEGEDTGLLSGKSYTRIVRVKEVGIGGESEWGYAKHIYAAPYPATNIRGTVKKTKASLNCQMYWETPTDAGHPIDEDGVVPQYSIAKPAAGMTCPDDASFEPLPPQGSTEGTEGKSFTIDTAIGIDKALFLRVTTQHDTDVVQSNAVLAGGDSVGALKLPAFTEAPAITASSVTVKATNESEVEDSFIVDYLERADGSLEILGLHDTPTKVYQVSGIENARVGIKAYVGEWNSVLKTINNIQMESAMLWSAGNVPVAPSADDFDVEQSTVANTVLVGWKYSWDDADACEVSWSTEPDAWMSTEDPESYVVLRGLENKLAIKGIEAGQPLYVRIRYLDGVDEDAILSPYSEIKSITISTVPAVPTLNLEKQFFTQGEPVTCSWVYVTTDGTEQAQAHIAERIGFTEDNKPIYGDPITTVETEQKTTIENTWATGTQHFIAVQVANGSGNWSEWSEAVAVTIAEPITCEITETSLVYDEIPINPETYTGNPITFDSGEQEKEVTSLNVELLPVQDGTPTQDSTVYNEPYLSKTSPSFNSEYDKLVGGTVAWNQLISTSSGEQKKTIYSGMFSTDNVAIYNGHRYLVSFLQPAGCAVYKQNRTNFTVGYLNYYAPTVATQRQFIATATGTSTESFASLVSKLETTEELYQLTKCMITDLTAMFGSTIADYIYNLEQATAGAGVAWFKKLFPKDYYPYNAGQLMSVKTSAHQMVGFNALDPNNLYQFSGNSVRTTNPIPVIGGQTYELCCDSLEMGTTGARAAYMVEIDADGNETDNASYVSSFTSLVVTMKSSTVAVRLDFYTIAGIPLSRVLDSNPCLHLVWDGERDGDYEAYKKWTYPLDSDLELRGIPKLDSANNLYYDGDTYESDGTVTRKYAIVDLGTLTWIKNTNAHKTYFQTTSEIADMKKSTGTTTKQNTFVCSKYLEESWSHALDDDNYDKYICVGWKDKSYVSIADTSYASSDASAFKTAMSGVYLVYELATPTTETVTGFTSPQAVGSTESYTDNRTVPIPVGHESTYANIYPISGYDNVNITDSNGTDTTTATVTLPHTVYGADVDVTGGASKETWQNIASYNGETISEPWLSSMDEYVQGTTPTTGAQVCYELATPTDLQTTPTDVELLTGVNNISADGDMELTIVDDIEKGDYLKSLPMTATVTGAGTGGRTTLMIARRGDYRIERPEGEDFKGHDGEVVYQNVYPGEAQQEIQLEDLQGDLDDGARYIIRASIEDDYGQSDSDEIEFTVNWDHKAIKPSATVVVTDVAKITIAESEDAEEGDYVDIYRQSVDGTELIYTGAEFGETYVDPYPTIGNFGYLIVGRSVYGDYVMEEAEEDYGQLAWRSVPAEYSSEKTLIDFNGDRIELYYNVDVSHSWAKDFKKTKYLGGSIVGDYVAGVERTASINFVSIPMIEEDMLESMRRLAEYEGEVHIRTREGSSFTACVQVNEDDNHDKAGFVRSFSLTVDKVDPVRLDGMTEAEWEEQNAVE